MKNLHDIHLTPEQKAAKGTHLKLDENKQELVRLQQEIKEEIKELGAIKQAVASNADRLLEVINAIGESPKGMTQKLEEIKSTNIVATRTLKEIAAKDNTPPAQTIKLETEGEVISIKGDRGDKGERGDRGSRFLGSFDKVEDLPKEDVLEGDFAYIRSSGELLYAVN